MNIILHIGSIVLGIAAFFSGPDAPLKMFLFGGLAALAFTLALLGDPPAKDYGVACERYGHFADDC